MQLCALHFVSDEVSHEYYGRSFHRSVLRLFILRRFVKKRQLSLRFFSIRNLVKVHIQVCLCQNVDLVAFLRIDQVMHQFYVHELSPESDAVVVQDITLKFQIVSVLGGLLIFKQTSEVFRASGGYDAFQAVAVDSSGRCDLPYI